MTRKLYHIINGEEYNPAELGLRQGSFLDTFDIKGQKKLFANPFGHYSATTLDKLLYQSERSNKDALLNPLTLDRAIEAIRHAQNHLDNHLRDCQKPAPQNLSSNIITNYRLLKGYSLPEIEEQNQALNNFVRMLELDRDAILGTMLGFNGRANDFFQTHEVLPTFAIIASGNLGLFESGLLIYTGILGQAAKNGSQLKLIIKPSIEDFLFFDLITFIPPDFRGAFSRVTWRSDVDWDALLTAKLINSVDGAIYFGQRSTLMGFKPQINDHHSRNHHFYHDHFPLMIIGSTATDAQLIAAAEAAVNLAYKNKGEACLSLQDVFVHNNLHDPFIAHLKQQVHQINSGLKGTPLSMYSKPFLERIENLQKDLLKSGAEVSGKVSPELNKMDIMVAHNLSMNHPILASENAAPFLAVAPYEDENTLIQALINKHLKPASPDRTSDKHIYAITIGINDDAAMIKYLLENACRLFAEPADGRVQDFYPYAVGTPHCGGMSFLADIFGFDHLDYCYRHEQKQNNIT